MVVTTHPPLCHCPPQQRRQGKGAFRRGGKQLRMVNADPGKGEAGFTGPAITDPAIDQAEIASRMVFGVIHQQQMSQIPCG